jgi:steroid 5-alpha reductase family enzyme
MQYNAEFQALLTLWLTVMFAVALVCFLVSEITRNYSQVDKLWSLMPVVYGWITVAAEPSPRVVLMAVLVTLWGLRLSYNFYRKGGYHRIPWKGEEDYRWKIMREHPFLRGRLRFGLFNLVFISFYQHLLILFFSSPFLIAAHAPDRSLTVADLFVALVMLSFLVLETIADNQQFAFHQEKRRAGKGEPRYAVSLKDGFLREGLWQFVRHPNFASEQGIWISFYFFSVISSGSWINPTVAGALLLVLLFMGSTQLTESISSRKYPDYKRYQQRVPRFIPRLGDLVRRKSLP